MVNPHIGSRLEDFLKEDGILEKCKAGAVKKIIAMELQEAIDKKGLTKKEAAAGIGTSRSALDRLLDPANTSVTLLTITRAASYLGKTINISLSEGAAT